MNTTDIPLRMRLPEVLVIHGVAARQVGAAVIDQPADNAQRAIGITLLEQERIRREISVQLDFAGPAGVLLP